MALRRWKVALIALLGMQTATAYGAEISTTDIDGGGTAILIVGPIETADDEKFNRIAANYKTAVVILASDGGSTLTALEIGKSIRLKGYATGVFNGYACNSACALIWLAGTPRSMARSAKIGFHATYVDVNGRAQESGVGNAIIGRYLTLLNLPEKAVIFATEQSPDSLNWLTAENLSASGIDANVVDDIKPNNATSKTSSSGKTVATAKSASSSVDWKKVGPWSVMVDTSLNNGCFIMAQWELGTILRLGFDPRPTPSYYVMLADERWKSLKIGETYEMLLSFGKESPWKVKAKGIDMSGTAALYVDFTGEAFWAEFDRNDSIHLQYDGKTVANLALKDTAIARREMVACQKTQKNLADDPFSR